LSNTELANKGGRLRKYQTLDELQSKIDSYFDECDSLKQPYAWTGLALFLGFTSCQALDNYIQRDEFSDAVRRAKLRCENYAETLALTGRNPSGPIFILKNYGWTDKEQFADRFGEEPLRFTINIGDPPALGRTEETNQIE
jgi:hypothetical protein